MSFSKRLVQARIKKELTQHELSNIIGVSRSAVNAWENPIDDNVFPNPKNLERCAAALGVEAAWLRFGAGEPLPKAKLPTMQNQPKDYKYSVALTLNKPIIQCYQTLKLFEIGPWLESKRNILQKGVNMSAEETQNVSFLYQIEGDSMVNNAEIARSLTPGELVLVDPTYPGGLNPGDFVMAQFGGISDDYKARIFYKDGIDAYLVALNPSIPRVEVNDNVKIVGKITQSIKMLK